MLVSYLACAPSTIAPSSSLRESSSLLRLASGARLSQRSIANRYYIAQLSPRCRIGLFLSHPFGLLAHSPLLPWSCSSLSLELSLASRFASELRILCILHSSARSIGLLRSYLVGFASAHSLACLSPAVCLSVFQVLGYSHSLLLATDSRMFVSSDIYISSILHCFRLTGPVPPSSVPDLPRLLSSLALSLFSHSASLASVRAILFVHVPHHAVDR